MPRPAVAHDLVLFTPGPLTTSKTVKQAMLRDVGSWDREFSEVVANVRRTLLAVAGLSQHQGYEAVPMQGSGSFGLEAVVTSITPPRGKLLVLVNGAYGDRIAKMATLQSIAVTALRFAENQPPALDEVRTTLAADPAITHVVAVHCETTSGILNPIEAIGKVARVQQIPEVFRRRSEYVLALAASQGYKRLILGAWGCGVFRNDPAIVATAFLGHLRHETWSGRFERVVFSDLDTSPAQETIAAFRRAVGQ